jgi:hypothetical protein
MISAITINVYGLRSASCTIHMGGPQTKQE